VRRLESATNQRHHKTQKYIFEWEHLQLRPILQRGLSGLLFDRLNPLILRASSDNTMRTRFRCYDY